MSKRYVLVHDCGHIVQPGDELTFEPNQVNHDLQCASVSDKVVFVGVVNVSDVIRVRYTEGGRKDIVDSFWASRFGCSIQEIDDDC